MSIIGQQTTFSTGDNPILDASDTETTKPKISPQPSQLERLVLIVVGMAVWGTVIWGTSLVQNVQALNVHSICGPWGCAPPVGAMLGVHLFWIALLGPILVGACLLLPKGKGSLLANCLFWGGLLGAIGLVFWASTEWLMDGLESQYAIRRGLFVLATSTDIPLLQVSLSGFVAKLVMPRRPKSQRTDRFEPTSTTDPLNETAKQATI